MTTLVCGHDAPPYGRPLCAHLRVADQAGYTIRYTGVGMEARNVCDACKDASSVEAEPVCEECFDAAVDDARGIAGSPEIIERPVPLGAVVDERPLPAGLGTVVDLAVTARGWLLLCEDGRLVLWDPHEDHHTEVARCHIAPEKGSEPWLGRQQVRRLHASPDGRFAAVVIDYGRRGQILDLTTGSVTEDLDNDGYHSDTVPFSLAFTVHEGRTLALHRPVWNRIAACEAETGRLVTGIPVDERADWTGLFHGTVLPSPDGTRIASDGWFWHPLGSVAVWNLAAWLAEGEAAWPESAGWTSVAHADYYWDRPMVWLDDDRLVVGGIGEAEELMVDGATVYAFTGEDGAEPVTEAVFAGPKTGPKERFHVLGGLLFSSGESGMEVWDPADGARLGTVPGLRPTHLDRSAGELLQLDTGAGVVRAWSATQVGP
ncbi:hypothetical protein [Streptomyces sp. NPDC046887]|uniref:hypothetical protein n=1 Tax=Streptomyces sp. NPDC046887 TaxID=3155472 RepID=UPI0033F0A2F7